MCCFDIAFAGGGWSGVIGLRVEWGNTRLDRRWDRLDVDGVVKVGYCLKWNINNGENVALGKRFIFDCQCLFHFSDLPGLWKRGWHSVVCQASSNFEIEMCIRDGIPRGQCHIVEL